jgi:hypothetical protein
MLKILDEKTSLLIKSLADTSRKSVQSAEGALRVLKFHLAGLRFLFAPRIFLMLASTEAAISAAVSKGP